jgi:hypothetical protein
VTYSLHLIVTLVLLVAVLVVFVSPVAALPGTALRAQQAAMVIFLSIALAAHRILVRFFSAPLHSIVASVPAPAAPLSSPSILTCVLLC